MRAPSEHVAIYAAAALGRHFGVDAGDVMAVLDDAPGGAEALLCDWRGWFVCGEMLREQYTVRGGDYVPTFH